MSEQNIKEVQIIPRDAVIDAKIGGFFLERLTLFITEFFPYKSKEHFLELVKNVKEDTNQDDPYVFHFTTLVSLQSYLEDQAKEQGKTKMIKINLKDGSVIPEENQLSPQTPGSSE